MNIIFNHVYVLLYVSVDILYCYVLKLILLRILNDLFAAVWFSSVWCWDETVN